jgi:hypothetical protein
MSWKRGQAGGFPGLLPARWELFLPRRKARGVILGKRSSSAPDSSGIRIVPYMGRSPRPGSRGLSHMWDNPPCRRAEELCSESAPPLRQTVRESGLSHIWDDPPGRGAADCPICGTIPLAEGPRSYARKASPLYAGQVGNPDCPIYGTIPPAGEPRTVPYVGQSPLPKGRNVPYGGTISIVEKSERSAVQTPFCNTSPFISPRRVKLMTGCFLLHRPMARRPGDARSAARGISTGVISRGTPGRAFQGGQPVRVGLGLQTVRLGFRRSRAAHRCSPPVSSATTPIPHALPMRFPGKVPGEGLERPRSGRGESPGWPGGWSAGGGPWETPRFRPGESHGSASSAFRGRIPGENPAWAWGDPVGKPRGHRGRPRGKAPGSTWGDGGSGGAGGCPTPRAGRFARETPQTG